LKKKKLTDRISEIKTAERKLLQIKAALSL
jgi:hypothetical protein